MAGDLQDCGGEEQVAQQEEAPIPNLWLWVAGCARLSVRVLSWIQRRLSIIVSTWIPWYVNQEPCAVVMRVLGHHLTCGVQVGSKAVPETLGPNGYFVGPVFFFFRR